MALFLEILVNGDDVDGLGAIIRGILKTDVEIGIVGVKVCT
nr:MAG TPA: hypothetical protein [Caudoviricetes sp.]